MAARRRKLARETQPGTARGERGNFLGGQQLRQLLAELTIQPGESSADALSSSAVGASPIQHHSTVRSLWSTGKVPVVHTVPVPVGHAEDVITFTVGIVDEDVERCDPSKRRRVFESEGGGTSASLLTLKDLFLAGFWHLLRRHQVHRVQLRICLVPVLHHTYTEHRRRGRLLHIDNGRGAAV